MFDIFVYFRGYGISKKIIIRIFVSLLQGIWETINFTSRDMRYCVQYFVYFGDYGISRKLNYEDICKLASRTMGNYPFYFQGYCLLCSIFR